MPEAPAFHGYGYGSWQTPGMFSTFHGRSGEIAGRYGEFHHGGSGTVSPYGHTQPAGGVYGLGSDFRMGTSGRGVGAGLRPPGWSGGAQPFSAIGAMLAPAAGVAKQQIAQGLRNRQQAFSAANSTAATAGFRALSQRGPLPDPKPYANWGAPSLEEDADSQEVPASRAAMFARTGTPSYQQPAFDWNRFLAVRNA